MLGLSEAAGHLIRCAQQCHTILWTREFGADLDVTGPQYALLSAIASSEGIDQLAASKLASLDRSSTADVVARLGGQGWLKHARDPGDGRRKVLHLTPLARVALRDVTRRVRLVQARLLEPVRADERAAFVDALRLVAYAGNVPSSGCDSGAVLTLRDTPGHLIRRAQQVHTVAWGIEVGRTLTPPQYAVLSALWAHPEGIDQSTAGEFASLDKSTMANVAQRLVKRGWVARERDVDDARRRLLRLTETVRRELRQVTPAVERVQNRLLAPLVDPAQRKQFMAGCQTLAYADGGAVALD